MANNDVLTLPRFLSRMPRFLAGMPAMMKGLEYAGIKGKTEANGLGWALERATDLNPNGVAVLQDDRRITYRQFNAWVNRIAHYLQAQGIGAGDVVGVFIENRPELLAVLAANAKIGAISALLNTSQRGKVLTHSFNLVECKTAIIGSELHPAFEEVQSDLHFSSDQRFIMMDQDTLANPGQAPEGWTNLSAACLDSPEHNPASTKTIKPRSPCFYIYTSGTTGLPKAAIFSHGKWLKAFGGMGYAMVRLQPKDVIYATTPFYHATGVVVCWGAALAGAAGLAIRRKFSATEFWQDVRRYNATCFGYVGELCRYLMNQPEAPDDRDNPAVKMVGNGLRPSIWKPFKKRFGIKEVLEVYASSEGNIVFTNNMNFDNTVGMCPGPYAIVRYDKESEQPIRNQSGFMERVGKGEAGLLLGKISDLSPFEGYTDKQKTEKSILRDVFESGDAWFNTGDMLRDIGFRHAQFVDRLGDTYRWKGENVSTTEVENLIGEHEAIEEVVAYGVEVPHADGRAGMVSITPRQNPEELDFKSFYHYLSQTMPGYAVPRFLRVRPNQEMTGTFKYKKHELKQEGYDIEKVRDAIYVLLPGKEEYQPVTQEIKQGIEKGQYRF